MGESWARRFLHRYHDKGFHIRYQETLEIRRFEAQLPKIVRIFFDKLEAARKKYNIHLEDCYNMDETGVRIGVGAKQRVVTRRARGRAFAPSSTNHDYVTMIECGSADKDDLPPMVMLPGKKLLEV
jgi:ATP-dependent exoDNAse (exonuclease V) alpha subunit